MFQFMSLIAAIEMLFLVLDDRMPNTMSRLPFFKQSLNRLGFMFVLFFMVAQFKVVSLSIYEQYW